MTLRDWLVHGHPSHDRAWTEVVAEFYQQAARDPQIAGYFAGVDLPTLQRHFLAALIMLTSHGLTVGTVLQMHTRHAHVRNSRGQPIDTSAYDRTITILVETLRAHGVGEDAIGQLAATIAPLRDAIATPR